MRVYVVEVEMSSPNKGSSSEEINDFTLETTFQFDKKTRQKIAATRMKYKAPIYQNTLKFFTIYICREDQVQEIMDSISEADKAMKEIHETLHASGQMWPLDLDEVKRGELYGKIIDRIKLQVFKTVFERLTEVVERDKAMTKQVKDSLVRMIHNLHAINVLNDQEITKQLNEIEAKIESETLQPIVEEMSEQLEGLSSRWGHIEIKPRET
jgi:hypothetical protein